jgi:uracil-DNA glycosylase family 4
MTAPFVQENTTKVIIEKKPTSDELIVTADSLEYPLQSPSKRKHPKALCEACPWFEDSGYADSEGPEDAKMAIVGIAPGPEEIKTGRVFIGPSGKLLDRILAHHKLNRSEIRLTNVVACHPKHRKSEDPPKEAIAACAPRLSAELQSREAIILLGKVAFQTVLQTREGITKARQGPARSSPLYPGARIVPTFHPAAALRSSDYFPSIVRDIKKIKESEASIKWEPPQFKVFDDEDTAISSLEQLTKRNLPYITVDIECAVEKDESFTHPDSLLCIGIGYDNNKAVVIGEKALKFPRVIEWLRRLLCRSKVICQNGKFDIQVMMRLGIIDNPYMLYADTMLASYALDERPGHHGLKGLASEILGAPDYSAELKPHLGKGAKKNYGNIPRPLLYRYNAYDAALTYNLWADKFEKELEENNLRSLHDFLVEASNELIYLELEGVRIDQDYLAWLLEDYARELAELENELNPWVDNPRSTPQVLAACKELLLMNKSTGAAILNGLLEGNRTAEQREFLEKILHYRKEAKLNGTYVKGTLKRLNNGRLYTTFKLHGTVTGRLSSANPNLQNIVRGSKIKNLFIPSEGNVFIQADYKQAEWRAIACLAEDSYLQRALSDPNQDIHSYVAALFFGPNFTKEQRVMAKTFVFGVAFGRGADAVARAFKVPVYKAQQYIDDYFRVIPDVVRWRKEVHEQIFKGGQALRTPFGRKRRYWLITKENKHDIEKEALAFLPQSIASDLTLHSLINLRKRFHGTDARIRLTVHDSILAECPKENKVDVGREMRRVMESTAAETFSSFVPFPIDLESGPSWGNLSELA